ncbi:MAG: hypothetical protein ACR2FZ_01880 [Thermoleophilaceae bacterium]
MPTLHRRIAVTCDPELDAALRRADRLLPRSPRRSAAATLRALALEGARALVARDDDARRAAAKLGAPPARRTLADVPAPLPDPEDERYGATDSLQWVRGKQ